MSLYPYIGKLITALGESVTKTIVSFVMIFAVLLLTSCDRRSIVEKRLYSSVVQEDTNYIQAYCNSILNFNVMVRYMPNIGDSGMHNRHRHSARKSGLRTFSFGKWRKPQSVGFER